jgi:exonuclease SbcC
VLIQEIRVVGFGPLADETLRLAPGMTVVYGPNESAKTSLHAATYAAICGLRRGRGQPKKDDAQFAARHRPWSGAPWKVVARVVLAGGREIELAHDLAGGVDCRATDIGLGRDVSNEIMFDGAPGRLRSPRS